MYTFGATKLGRNLNSKWRLTIRTGSRCPSGLASLLKSVCLWQMTNEITQKVLLHFLNHSMLKKILRCTEDGSVWRAAHYEGQVGVDGQGYWLVYNLLTITVVWVESSKIWPQGFCLSLKVLQNFRVLEGCISAPVVIMGSCKKNISCVGRKNLGGPDQVAMLENCSLILGG